MKVKSSKKKNLYMCCAGGENCEFEIHGFATNVDRWEVMAPRQPSFGVHNHRCLTQEEVRVSGFWDFSGETDVLSSPWVGILIDTCLM